MATLSGCTTETLQEAERDPPAFEAVAWEDVEFPVRQRQAVAEAAIEDAATGDVGTLDEFSDTLEEHGISVEGLVADESEEEMLSLEYVAETPDERGTMHHLGVVAGTYAAAVAGSHGSNGLDVSLLDVLDVGLLDAQSEPFGEYEVRRHWAEAYNDGELTGREYVKEITVTLAST